MPPDFLRVHGRVGQVVSPIDCKSIAFAVEVRFLSLPRLNSSVGQSIRLVREGSTVRIRFEARTVPTRLMARHLVLVQRIGVRILGGKQCSLINYRDSYGVFRSTHYINTPLRR